MAAPTDSSLDARRSTRSDANGVDTWIPAAILASAAIMAVLDLGTTVVISGPGGLLEPTTLVGHLLTLVLTGTIALGAIVLARSTVDPARYPRIGTWYVGGLLADLAINLVLIALYGSITTTAGDFQWAVFAAALGGVAGFIVGGTEARAIDRAVASEREAVRARAMTAQRDWLDYMNSLLRHEVLNNSNVIEGYAQLIVDDADDPELSDHAVTIRRQARDMTSVIQDVRVFLDATQGEPTIRRVDLVDVLRKELADVRDTFPDAETDLQVEGSVEVAADEVLGRVFANLFRNAIEHNDAATPRVTASVTVGDDTAAVRIVDNGAGIPPSVRESLFDRGEGDRGLGLYLVGVLVDRYGGDVELIDTGPDGTTFTVELPLADAEGAGRSGASEPASGAFPLEHVSGALKPTSPPASDDD